MFNKNMIINNYFNNYMFNNNIIINNYFNNYIKL